MEIAHPESEIAAEMIGLESGNADREIGVLVPRITIRRYRQ
jgi:hypothetical protein